MFPVLSRQLPVLTSGLADAALTERLFSTLMTPATADIGAIRAGYQG